MKRAKSLLTVSLVAMLSVGCVTPPPNEEIANLDYGSCPSNYETKIKENFQSRLIVVYLGEPIIWPPQRYWFKESPLLGGKLYAGFLVPVTVEQKHRLEPRMNGKQLYGFIFKDNELVKTLDPMRTDSISISESTGPLPKDERDWKVGHSTSNDARSITEWVLPGETVQNWSELITLQSFSNVSMNLTPEKLARDVAEGHKKNCTNVSLKILTSSLTEVLYERVATNCAPLRDEYAIGKYIRGPRTMSSIFYTKTSALNETEKKKWTGIVERVKLMNECQK